MPSTHSLSVNTATTFQLQNFLNSAKDESSLHAKIGKDGSCLLYVSKGNGTGLKQALFPKKFEQRKIAARRAVLEITRSNIEGNNTPFYNSIASGLTTKETMPLMVGELKSKLSEQIDLHQQALAEKYFKGIELDFADGTARTPFSAHNDKITPLTKGLQTAMEGIRDAAYRLNGSPRQELRYSTTAFIGDHLQNGPFDAPYEYRQIIDFCLNFDRNISKIVNQLLERAPHDNTPEAIMLALADNFKKLKFCTTLFSNEEFIKSCPPTNGEVVRELGNKLGTLHSLLNQPEGFYASLGALTGLAINSPVDFRRCLDKFKSSFILANLPDGAIVDKNGNLSGSQTTDVVPNISKYPELRSPIIGYAG